MNDTKDNAESTLAPCLPTRLSSTNSANIRIVAYYFAAWMMLLVVMGMLSLAPILASNDMSRWDTVWALTHGKGYIIDDAPYGGVDRVKRNGHFYSSKPPLYPTIIAGVTTVIHIITGWELPQDDKYIVRIVVILFNIIPFAIVVVLYGRFLDRRRYDWETSSMCLVAAAAGTYLTTYSAILNNHTVAAWSFFFTIYCLIRIVYDNLTQPIYFVGAGLFAAWTVCNELPAGLFGLIVFVWLARKQLVLTLRYFVPVAALVLGMFLYTIYLSTDSFVPYYFKSELYLYEGSYWNHPTGVSGSNDSRWFYLFNMVLGHHGMFSLTPILLFGAFGLLTDQKFRGIHILTVSLTIVILGFLVLKKSPDYGGWCHGARWTFWVIPGLLLAMPHGLSTLPKTRMFRWATYFALLVSLISVVLGWKDPKGPWDNPWIRTVMHKLKLIDY